MASVEHGRKHSQSTAVNVQLLQIFVVMIDQQLLQIEAIQNNIPKECW